MIMFSQAQDNSLEVHKIPRDDGKGASRLSGLSATSNITHTQFQNQYEDCGKS